MAELVTVTQLKEHLNIKGTADDVKLLHVLNAAERHIFDRIGGPRYSADDFYVDFGEISEPFEAAVLLFAQTLYDGPRPSGTSPNIFENTIKALLRVYIDPKVK